MKPYSLTVQHREPLIWVYRLKLKDKCTSVVVGTVTQSSMTGEFVARDLFYKVIRQVRVKTPTHPDTYHIIIDSLKDYLDDILLSLEDNPFKEDEPVGLSLVPIEPHHSHRNI